MFALKAGILNEVVKIVSRKKMIFFFILSLLLPAVAGLALDRVQSGFGLAAVSAGDLSMRVLGLLSGFLLPLVVFMTAVDLFTAEEEAGTLKVHLTRPVSRFQLYAAKQLVLLLTIIIFYGGAFLTSLPSALLLQGRGEWLAGILPAAAAYAASLLPMAVLGTLAIFIVQAFKNATGALSVLIILFVLLRLFGTFLPGVSSLLPTAYLDWHVLWSSGAGVAGAGTLLAAWGLLSFTAGYLWFDKKEW